MKDRRSPGVIWQLLGAAAIWFSAGPGCSSWAGPGSDLPPAPNTLGRKVAISVESSVDGATISANGSLKGAAPVTVELELDDLGDVAIEMELTADFGNSANATKNGTPAVVTYRLARGERPPSVVRFDTEGATAH